MSLAVPHVNLQKKGSLSDGPAGIFHEERGGNLGKNISTQEKKAVKAPRHSSAKGKVDRATVNPSMVLVN